MKKIYIAVALCAVVLALAILLHPRKTEGEDISTKTESPLEHRQETWISALEWCESRGVITAINPKDSDGTPSYYSWQWKPSTFKMYAIRYGLIATSTSDADAKVEMEDYSMEREIVRNMISDKSVNFAHEFPDCVKNKVGQPPRV